MPLTNDQIAQLEIQKEIVSLNHTNALQVNSMNLKLESIRIAKEILLENSRSKPVDTREITATDIKNFAQVIENYVNS